MAHLAAQLDGQPLTTIIASPRGKVELRPVAQAQARAHWRALLLAWHEGMCRPLPFAPRTAAAWLFEVQDGGGDPDIGAEAPADSSAQAVYEGSEGFARSRAERDEDPHLKRVFADFAALWSAGELHDWAVRLLAPLIDNLRTDRESGAPARSPGGDKDE